MRLTCMILGLAILTVFAGRADEDYLPAEELDGSLKRYWQLQLPCDPGWILRDLYLVDDQLYAAGEDGYVYAIDAATGAIRWGKQITRSGYRVWRPCHAGDRTIFVTPASVSQYDRRYGRPLRRFDLRFPAAGPAASDGVYFYVGGLDRRFYAFHVDQDFETWKFVTAGPAPGAAAVENGALYVASEDGGVYSCTSGRLRRWIVRTSGANSANVAVDGSGVYVASQDRSLYLFEKNTGGRRWRARLSSPLDEPPVTTPEVAYQYSKDDGVVALEVGARADEERARWTLPEGRSLLTVHEKKAYVLSTTGEILVVDERGGAITQRILAPGFTVFAPSPANATVYVASSDGRIFCARPGAAAPLQAADVVAAITEPIKPLELAAGDEPTPEELPAAPGEALESDLKLPPIGGKSKVTRSFFGESTPGSPPKAPAGGNSAP